MFRKPQDTHYGDFFRALHAELLFDWYLEIGCRTGKTFSSVRGNTVAVDPFFLVNSNVIQAKPALLIFQKASDEFFSSGAMESLGIRFGFSFLDGMHLFEYLLRDFMNTERLSNPGGVIALHDCCPYSHEMTTRDLDNIPKGAWTGDVWKLIPILQEYRPDLKLTILGCAPTGLVLVSNLDPDSRVLLENYDEIVARWVDVSLEGYGVKRFFESFTYAPARPEADVYRIFDAVRIPNETFKMPQFVTP